MQIRSSTSVRQNRLLAFAVLGTGVALAVLSSVVVWLQAARKAKANPIDYLRHPIKKVKTLQVGDRATANLAELNFNEEGTFLYVAVDHISEALKDTDTHKINNQLFVNTLAVSDNSLARDEIIRTNSSPVNHKCVLIDRETTLATSQQQHRFITIGESENSKATTLNLWTRDTASNPDGSMPMQLVNALRFEGFAVSKAEISPGGDFVAIALRNDTASRLIVVDAFTGKPVRALELDSPITAIAFSPNNKILATAHENRTTYTREIATGKALREFSYTALSPPRNQWETKVAFSYDGTLLAFGDSAGIQLWDVNSGAQKGTFALKDESGTNVWTGTNSLAVSPDNRWIVSDAGHTNKLYIWDIRTGNLQRILGTSAHEAAFSPDGERLATGDRYGKIAIWQMPSQL